MVTSLIFIATCLGVLVSIVTIVLAVVRRNWKLAAKFGLLLGPIGYFSVLLLVSLTSSQTRLALNQERCFDEMCFSVIGVNKVKTVSNPSAQITAQGSFYLVQLQLRNAAKRLAQKPDNPGFEVVDQQGHTYSYSQIGTAVLTNVQSVTGINTTLWETKLEPAEKSVRTLVFDLPSKVANPCLVISEGSWPTPLIIGDDNSFFHKKPQICLN